MQYVTNCAVIFKGDRVGKGVIVDMQAEEAAAYGDQLSPVGATPTVEVANEPEKALDEMSAAELKEKAAALGLKTTGSKADLLDRISLALSGNPESNDA